MRSFRLFKIGVIVWSAFQMLGCSAKRVIVKDCRPLHQDFRECELVGKVED
jgi:hypothetical protein